MSDNIIGMGRIIIYNMMMDIYCRNISRLSKFSILGYILFPIYITENI